MGNENDTPLQRLVNLGQKAVQHMENYSFNYNDYYSFQHDYNDNIKHDNMIIMVTILITIMMNKFTRRYWWFSSIYKY